MNSFSRILFFLALIFMVACSSAPKHDHEKLEKYPKCYHNNVKISQKCIKMNEAGNETTALELENKAYPGQYK